MPLGLPPQHADQHRMKCTLKSGARPKQCCSPTMHHPQLVPVYTNTHAQSPEDHACWILARPTQSAWSMQYACIRLVPDRCIRQGHDAPQHIPHGSPTIAQIKSLRRGQKPCECDCSAVCHTLRCFGCPHTLPSSCMPSNSAGVK